MNSYEMKQEARRERLERAADKARASSEAAQRRSNQLVENIPFGQPILVGHHSEKAHRRTLEKSWNAMGKCVAEAKRAEELDRRAAAVGSGGISSDDPEAVSKLKVQLADMLKKRDLMKKMNEAYRMAKRMGMVDNPKGGVLMADVHKIVEKVGLVESMVVKVIQWKPAYSFEKAPIAPYQLQNLGANIKRVEGRIKLLESRVVEDREEDLANGVRYEECAEDNRVRFFFPGKPSYEVRKLLKSYGFRWAPSVGAWQRMLTGSGQFAAGQVRNQLASVMG